MSTITIEHVPTREVTTEVTKHDILTRAADVLEEFGWCQGAGAKDEYGCICEFGSRDPIAVSFCLWGAIERARLDLGLELDFNMADYSEVRSTSWNDDATRTKEEVVRHLRHVAKFAT